MKRFMGSRHTVTESNMIILGLPMDFTSSRLSGSRGGPDSVRQESWNIESYSPFLDKDLEETSFYDLGNISFPFGDVERSLENIRLVSNRFFNSGKKILSIGGEHLVSFPLIRSAFSVYPDLKVIHLDAHADLRSSYYGGSLSHASVMRLVAEKCLKSTRDLHQFCIRSGTKDEYDWAYKNTTFYPHKPETEEIHRLHRDIGTNPVYLTVDIDVVDPSGAPGTGTPEPGGLTSSELLNIVHSLRELNLVGMDIVEICPSLDHNGITSLLGAKTIRESLLQWGL